MNESAKERSVHITLARFERDPLHGGTLRSRQLQELLADEVEACIQRPELRDALCLSWRVVLVSVFKVLGSSPARRQLKSVRWKSRIKFSLMAACVLAQVKAKGDVGKVFVEVGPNYSQLLPVLLKQSKKVVWSFPHNVESLVGFKGPIQGNVFESPIEKITVSHSDRIFAISEFDAYVFGCMGGDSTSLPFFPDLLIKERCLEIAAARAKKKCGNYFLAIGSAGNPPTKHGLSDLIFKWSQLESGVTLVVAGRGTESLASASFAREDVVLEGSVSEQRMSDLIVSAKAVLINQPPTSGFLTKLVELNLCGVPQVITSNYAQGNGLEGYGVYVAPIERVTSLPLSKMFAPFSPPDAESILSS